jgi:hypothetical protein
MHARSLASKVGTLGVFETPASRFRQKGYQKYLPLARITFRDYDVCTMHAYHTQKADAFSASAIKHSRKEPK